MSSPAVDLPAPPGLLARLSSLSEVVAEVASLDFATVSSRDAVAFVSSLARLARFVSAAQALAARRVEETAAHVAEGFRDAPALLASAAGVDRPAAVAQLAAARVLDSSPDTASAFRSGQLSMAQAQVVASAGPDSGALLDRASKVGLRSLQDAARKLRPSLPSRESQESSRMCRVRTEHDGMVSIYARLCPEEGAAFVSVFNPRRDRVFRAARRSRLHRRPSQYDADALMAIVADADAYAEIDPLDGSAPLASPKASGRRRYGGGSGRGLGGGGAQGRARSRPRAMVNVVIDHAALVRGERGAGERCLVPGVGEISVEAVRGLLGDACLRLLVAKGSDVVAATSVTRTVPASVRAALELRDQVCAVPGCDETRHLENDHVREFALGGATSLENLARLCRWHHQQKTFRGYRLLGPPGERRWVAPDGPDG